MGLGMVVTSKVNMRRANIRFTSQDYQILPEDKRYEILDGDLCMVASPNTRHQRISKRLFVSLIQQIEQEEMGEVFQAPFDVILAEDTIVQPDILFVVRSRMNLIGEHNFRGAPDLAIEILSSASRQRDLEIKRKIYARFGIREYWIVDPDTETIEVLSWSEIGYARYGVYAKSDFLSSPLLPAFQLRISELFIE